MNEFTRSSFICSDQILVEFKACAYHLFRQELFIENLALRYQLEVLQRYAKIHGSPNKLSIPVMENIHLQHMNEIVAMDFFNATTKPPADWTSLELIQAFPFDTAPRFLIRDRDGREPILD